MLSVAADFQLIDAYDQQISTLETHLVRSAQIDDPATVGFLRSIPGIARILRPVMLFELDRITHLPEVKRFLSYALLMPGTNESAEKIKGFAGLTGLCRPQARQRPSEVGLLGGRVVDSAKPRAGGAVAAAAVAEGGDEVALRRHVGSPTGVADKGRARAAAAGMLYGAEPRGPLEGSGLTPLLPHLRPGRAGLSRRLEAGGVEGMK